MAGRKQRTAVTTQPGTVVPPRGDVNQRAEARDVNCRTL